MAKPKSTNLPPKYWKALELVEEGSLSLREIAQSVGMSEHTMYDLMSGDTKKTGTTGELFYAELQRIHSRNVQKTKHLHKDNEKLALAVLNERLRKLKSMKPTKVVAAEITKILNSMGKLRPSVAINNNTLNYFKGLNPEDLVHEYRRLSSIARSSLEGRGVQGPKSGGPGEVLGIIESRSRVQEEPETPIL